MIYDMGPSPGPRSFPMGSFSAMHWIVVLAIILIVFGAGKLPNVMGDFAKGVKAFRRGMQDDQDDPAALRRPPGDA